jgi:outer membrane protein TolC
MLSGTLNYTADSFKNVFRSSSMNGNFGPSFQWNILNYGRGLNNVRLQDARFQELIANYQNRVLIAQQEVEDGMVTFHKAKQRSRLQEESVKAGQAAERIGWARWITGGLGLADYTTVTLIQQNLVQQQDILAQSQGEIALGLIQVYRAAGGGWQTRNPACEPAVRPQLSDTPAPTSPSAAQFGRPF